MKKFLVIVVLFVGQFLSAQAELNRYQYVIVPSRFKFTKETDQYRLNTLTKLLLEKYKFKAYLDTDRLPADAGDSNCNMLYADVLNSGNFLVTKMQVILKDCKGKIVYESGIGSSKEKEFKVSYNLALRQAFQSFETLHYQYAPATSGQISATSNDQTVVIESFENNADLLLVQPILNGYQLVDKTPKIVMQIFKTSNPTIFLAVKGIIHGALISKDNQWVFEYYQNDKLISENVNVKISD